MKQTKNAKLPSFLRSFFWDTDFEEIDIKTHAFLVIKRVLDRGNLRDVQ